MKSSINSIESLGAVDGPGLRTVIFFNGCKLRCKYCHNPEMWTMGEQNYTTDELVDRIIRNKNYFGKKGGVTFSGGEPLLHVDFLIELCKKLKKENINIALDTAGIGIGKYEELLPLIDLIIYDTKDITPERFKELTNGDIEEAWKFLEIANSLNKDFWVRQVVVPGVHDNKKYITDLSTYIHEHINNVLKIEFLPYHKLGSEKYVALGLPNPYKDLPEMDETKCNELYDLFINIYNK